MMKVSVRQNSKKRTTSEEKNRILTLVDFIIPYVKELRKLPLVKSVTASILMQQLDYWFNIQGKESFYKFLEPCDNQHAYKTGDSWTEELGMSADEFKTAFGQIGVSYKSKAKYDAAPDKFQGKYYCSYFNRVNRETRYFRNNELVDRDLNSLFLGNGKAQFVETDEVDSVEVNSSFSVEEDIPGLVEDETVGLESTETTTDNTAKITTNNTSKREERKSLSPNERSKTEETTNRKDIDNSYYSTSLDTEDCSDTSDNKEVIEGIPVIGDSYSYSQPSQTAGHLPDDFEVTDEMLEWIEIEKQKGNVASEIDISHATQKFIVHNEGKKHKFWIQQWKLWMMNERPKQAVGGYMTASQKQAQLFKELEEETGAYDYLTN
jgi:uncharacterized protein YodC (DUF2158 family)